MQALVLAAGMGRRLGALTKDKTKCMLELHGLTLIERSLDALVAAGVDRIVLVVGYGAEAVQDLVGEGYRGVPVSYVTNREYATTNNIRSLHLARDEFAMDDTLLLESDLVYDASIIKKLIAQPDPDVAVVAKHEAWMDGTVVTLSEDNAIEQFIPKKGMDNGSFAHYFKTVNIYKFSQEFIQRTYLPFLEAYISSAGANEYYEQVLRVLAGVDQQGLVALPLDDEKWYEIDDIQDYEIASTIFAPPEIQYDSYLSRHGGYWRFPRLRDFCYLVNPYFPPTEMTDEMQRSFEVLLSEYPSTASVQDRLAGKMFGCDAKSIVVGNGAAEMICALGMAVAGGRVAVPIPTFEEYLKRFPHADVVEFKPANADLRPDLDRLKEVADQVDLVVLVNPDNPSGQCLKSDDVLALAAYMEGADKRLVLDESFVDFAEPDHCASLLRQEVLDAYPHMVILKSISKSYGVPGARLGVLASADAEFIDRIRPQRAVWNINSYGEYFLQIVGKYKDRYEDACDQIRAERTRFLQELSQVRGIRVLPSHANYFLCEVTGVSARELSERLLREHTILIKDASGKPGLDSREFVRIAVKGSDENDALVSAARQVMSDLGILQTDRPAASRMGAG